MSKVIHLGTTKCPPIIEIGYIEFELERKNTFVSPTSNGRVEMALYLCSVGGKTHGFWMTETQILATLPNPVTAVFPKTDKKDDR